MKKRSKLKWLLVFLTGAILIFTASVLITRGIINKLDANYVANNNVSIEGDKIKPDDEKTIKKKFIDEYVEDEEKKEMLKFQIELESAKKNNEDIQEVILDKFKDDIYTEEYIRYTELSDEEKKKVEVIPRKEKIQLEKFDKIKEEQDKDLGEITDEKEAGKKNENNDKVDNNKGKDDKKEEDKKTEEKDDKKEDNKKNEENEDKKEDDKKTEEKDDDKKKEEENNVIPEKFDLRDVIDIKVDDQEGFGLCWDFASTTSLETNLALTKNQNYDFSEIHIAYLTSDEMNGDLSRKATEGGTFQYWNHYAKERKSFVLEDKLEYRRYEEEEYGILMNMDAVDILVTKTVDFPSFTKSDVGDEKFKEYQNIVKRHIMNYSSIYACVGAFENANTNLYFTDMSQWSSLPWSDEKGTHAVSIIGWDDNYSKENFKNSEGKTPENDGAYIALNSWGTDYGNEGYLYISYEDHMVNKYLSGVVSTDEKYLIELSEINNIPLENYIKNSYKQQIIEKNGKLYVTNDIFANGVLNLENIGLKTLNGLEKFDKLFMLNIANNEIEDISALKDMDRIDGFSSFKQQNIRYFMY